MMKMKIFKNSLKLLATIILLAGCTKDENPVDLEPPVISMTLPVQHEIHDAESGILFNANFSDNEALMGLSPGKCSLKNFFIDAF